ncbi:MAG: type III-B CRISPR module-associated protein Cmr5 [Thaumarchaeota archaeon]|nr:MAG: type III-B CRISPR module-associated protein Cmr5 [Nitrososphaerota archaeon]
MSVHLISEEAVRAALKDFNSLIKLLEEHPKGDDIGGKIRARIREILTYTWSRGLAPTLTFYLAKGEEDTIKIVKEAFEGEEKLVEELEKLAPEKIAYAIIFYLTFKRLRQLNFVSIDPKDPRSCLRELIEMDPVRRMYATNLLTFYLLEFKKLCEATFEPER